MWPCLPHVEGYCRGVYPQLVRIPLDRATFEVRALVPRTGDIVRDGIGRTVRALRDRVGPPPRETRFTRMFSMLQLGVGASLPEPVR